MRKDGNFLFTSESVSEGHPDKVADRISDAILDAHLAKDPEARVACETLVTTNRIVLAGELRSASPLGKKQMADIARDVVKDIGYDQEGFSWKNAEIENYLHEQSRDIAMGVDSSEEKDEGAGDQGIMFGYASNETDTLMPAPLYYAHRILQKIRDLRHAGDPSVAQLQPDAKSQVTLRYDKGVPIGAHSIVISTQHDEGASQEAIRHTLKNIVRHELPDGWMPQQERDFLTNPTGAFVIGGPDGDCGLTGRKIIVDTYGGAAPHGGGAFSGKDPTKVDRSAAYACRYLAKNVVAAGLADRCTIQLSYAIGISYPLSVYVDLAETGKDIDEDRLGLVLRDVMDLTPRGIRNHLDLNRPIYTPTSAYGHFGRKYNEKLGTFTWERTDLVDELRRAFNR